MGEPLEDAKEHGFSADSWHAGCRFDDKFEDQHEFIVTNLREDPSLQPVSGNQGEGELPARVRYLVMVVDSSNLVIWILLLVRPVALNVFCFVIIGANMKHPAKETLRHRLHRAHATANANLLSIFVHLVLREEDVIVNACPR